MFAREQLTREPEVAHVNEATCAGCLACLHTCPYKAIQSKDVTNRAGQVIAPCRHRQPRPVHGLRDVRGRLPFEERRPGRFFRTTNLLDGGEPGMSSEQFEPKIIAYVCNWCTYLGADLAGTNRLEYPANVRIVRLPCTGRIDFNLIVKAFEIGADAVLVSGCHPGDCHYTSGNYHARRRWMMFRQLLETLGIDMRRIHFTWISAAEGKKWQEMISEITDEDPRTRPVSSLPGDLRGPLMLDELHSDLRDTAARGNGPGRHRLRAEP